MPGPVERKRVREIGQEVRSENPARGVSSGKPVTPMKSNVGSYDAAVRFVLGCLILGIGNHTHSWWGLLGLVPIVTSFAGYCPLYLPFHIDTTFTDRPHC